MRKILAIAKVNLAQYLSYRLSFVLWRVRVIVSLLLIYFLWSSVYSSRLTIFSYSRTQMMTYILLIYLIGDVVYSSRTADLASQIRNGTIINQLLKPFPFFAAIFSREAVDKLLNLVFSALEIAIIVFLLKPTLFIQTDPIALLLTVVAILLGIVIAFFISFTISLIAFWSTEVWAPRFVFMVLITVLSGSYFPLDILPNTFYQLLLFTPFPYFTYLPTKIFINGLQPGYLWLFGISGIWAFISYRFAKFVWHKGITEFSFFGR